MRVCPVCGSDGRKIVLDYPFYRNNIELYLCACSDCGMHFVDATWLTQEWFDLYYSNEYKTDDKPYSDARLNSLASFIVSYEPRSVLDIGGMDGELQSRILKFGVPCDISGVGDVNENKYDIVVLSHTLEHIYDVSVMFQRILRNLGNRLIIEVPIWWNYDNLKYDYHWQHINKFTSYHLEEMLYRQGFGISLSIPLADYREYHCRRVMAWKES